MRIDEPGAGCLTVPSRIDRGERETSEYQDWPGSRFHQTIQPLV